MERKLLLSQLLMIYFGLYQVSVPLYWQIY